MQSKWSIHAETGFSSLCFWRSPQGLVINAEYYDIVISGIELQSSYYVFFQPKILENILFPETKWMIFYNDWFDIK